MNRRLLRTPRPHFDESLKGLLVRAAEQNGYSGPLCILHLAGINGRLMSRGGKYTEQVWQGLSEVLNLEIPTLYDIACLQGIENMSTNVYNVFGHRIHKYFVRMSAPKVCPGCLRDSSYIRKVWDIASFTCCPIHKTVFIDKCPSCGKGISWDRRKVSICECGQDWREIALPESPYADITLSRLILQVCGLLDMVEDTVSSSHNSTSESEIGKEHPLGSVGLPELLSAVHFFAGQHHGVVDTSGKTYVSKLAHKDLHGVLSQAVSVFHHWPTRFYELLEENKGKSPLRKSPNGVYKDFGKIYRALFNKKSTLPKFMREAFRQYITTTGGYAGWCRALSDDELGGKKYMTQFETAKVLQIGVQRVIDLQKKGYLKGPSYQVLNQERFLIEADSVKELREKWRSLLTPIKTKDMLGIGIKTVITLAKNGYIEAYGGLSAAHYTNMMFEEQEVIRLIKRVEEKICYDRVNMSEKNMPFLTAIKRLAPAGIGVVGFIQLILDGDIVPIGKSTASGFAGLLFNENEIKDYARLKEKECRSKCIFGDNVKLTNINCGGIAKFVKRGLIPAEKVEKENKEYFLIRQEEIDCFFNMYCTVGELAKKTNRASWYIVERLMANGIMPVSGPKTDGGWVHYFRKTDLSSADIYKILSTPMESRRKSKSQIMKEKGAVNSKQLQKLLGCTRGQMMTFISKGQIRPLNQKNEKSGRRGWLFFSLEEVERFKKKIAA